MSYRVELLIIKNKAKLEQMIRENYSKERILKQSRLLDKYLNLKTRELVK